MATEKIEAEILEDTFTFALSAKATVLFSYDSTITSNVLHYLDRH